MGIFQTVKSVNHKVDLFFRERQMTGMKDILIFLILTLAIHFSWRFWENNLGLYPIERFLAPFMDWLSIKVLYQSTWLLNTLMGYNITIGDNIMYFPSGYDVAINRSCSGMKQIMQFVILMAIFRGSWMKKLWFIPVGVILVHITNILRIFFVGVLSMNHPAWMKFAHDDILRWMFYLTICGLWLVWVKVIARRYE